MDYPLQVPSRVYTLPVCSGQSVPARQVPAPLDQDLLPVPLQTTGHDNKNC